MTSNLITHTHIDQAQIDEFLDLLKLHPQVIAQGVSRQPPPGWLLCDGTNGTPDLRSHFVAGQDEHEDEHESNTTLPYYSVYYYMKQPTTPPKGDPMNKLIERRKAQATTAPPAHLITIRRAHQETGVTVRTIQNWASAGRITAQRDGPKLWLVSVEDVLRVAATLKPGKQPK